MPSLIPLEYNDSLAEIVNTNNANVFISLRGDQFTLYFYQNKWYVDAVNLSLFQECMLHQ